MAGLTVASAFSTWKRQGRPRVLDAMQCVVMGCLMKVLGLVACVSMALSATAVSASPIVGSTVNVGYFTSNTAGSIGSQHPTLQGQGNFTVVDPGVETTIANASGTPLFDVNLNDSVLTITSRVNSGFSGFTAFNGLRIQDIFNAFPNFVNFVLLPGNTINGIVGTFDVNNLYVNFANVGSIVVGQSASFQVTTAAPTNVVPVPAALPLFLSAIGGIGFASRRRKTL